jgi:hypothetical protein
MTRLELKVQTQRAYKYGSAVAVVSWVIDVLQTPAARKNHQTRESAVALSLE